MTVIQTHPKPSCPDCGAQMKLIRPSERATWKEFWGCTRFSDGCRGKVQIKFDGTPDDDSGAFGPGDFD